MATGFDTATSAVGNSVASLQWLHNCAAGTALLMDVNQWSGLQLSAAVYNSVAFSLLASDFTNAYGYELYGISNPNAGNNTISIGTAGYNGFFACGAASFTGAKNAGAFGTVGRGSAVAVLTLSVSSTTTDLVAAGGVSSFTGINFNTDVTSRMSALEAGTSMFCAIGTKAGAATVSASVSGSNIAVWGLSILASAGGAAAAPVFTIPTTGAGAG
jgi:hypothetical protein